MSRMLCKKYISMILV